MQIDQLKNLLLHGDRPPDRSSVNAAALGVFILSFATLSFVASGLATAQVDPKRNEKTRDTEITVNGHQRDLGDDASTEIDALLNMNVEDLLRISVIEVSSVTGNEQEFFETPAAISVLTSEDIRRAGHVSLPEALRMIPGMQVARISSNQWAISARGFGGRFANKLQVLVDGRSVYEPLFAGVFWDEIELNTEDIDRIEVVRGPGATLWGANAVNGVINITTKSAADTLGGMVTGGFGTEYRGFGSFRYGNRLGDDDFFRVWGKYVNDNHFVDAAGSDRPDDWDEFHGGVRFDFNTASATTFTLITDFNQSNRLGEGLSIPVPTGHLASITKRWDGRVTRGNILGRWRGEDSPTEWWQLQTYYSYSDRVGIGGLEEKRHTVNVDYRNATRFDDSTEFLWGLELNQTWDEIEDGPQISFDPGTRSSTRISGFAQSTIELKENLWHLMVGSKFEHNNYTGFEIQPSARLWWTPDDENTWWASVSRPVRTPSRFESDFSLISAYADTGLLGGGPPSGIIIPLTLNGKNNIESERLIAYELGYRRRFNDNLLFDFSAYINDYDNLISNRAGKIVQFSNDGSAESYGFELSSEWKPADNWRLEGSYSYIELFTHDSAVNDDETNQPVNQFQVRSMLDLTKDLEFNSAFYFVDNVSNRDAKSYGRLDLGLTWRPRENLEIALWGQNLLDPSHREFAEPFFNDAAGEVERGVFLQATIHF